MSTNINVLEKKAYWDNYYSQGLAPTQPSNFAKIVLSHISTDEDLLELGCGNARDSIFFASQGIDVQAIDRSTTAIENNNAHGIPNIKFINADFTEIDENLLENKIQNVYSRFTLHSVKKEGYIRTLNWCQNNIPTGGKFCIEARTINCPLYGQGTPCPDNGYINTHYRRFLTMKTTMEDLTKRGFNLLYAVEDYVDAWYNDDHAVVLRIVAEKV